MKGYVDFYPSEQVAKALNQIKLLTFKGSQSDNIDTVKLTLMQIRDYVTNLTMDTKDERN